MKKCLFFVPYLLIYNNKSKYIENHLYLNFKVKYKKSISEIITSNIRNNIQYAGTNVTTSN
jgi:hypothetical protein